MDLDAMAIHFHKMKKHYTEEFVPLVPRLKAFLDEWEAQKKSLGSWAQIRTQGTQNNDPQPARRPGPGPNFGEDYGARQGPSPAGLSSPAPSKEDKEAPHYQITGNVAARPSAD